MTTINTFAGRITGPRLRVEGVGSPWQQKRPHVVALGFTMIDNSTGVSARKRRRL